MTTTVENKKHQTERISWSGGMYGGQEILFIDHDMKLILTGNTRSIKNSMWTRSSHDVKRLRDLKEDKAYYINYHDYTEELVNNLPYTALRILCEGNKENLSLEELKALPEHD